MDIHEEDKEHLINAHASALEVVEKFSDWVKIDCEKGHKMLTIAEINKMILREIL